MTSQSVKGGGAYDLLTIFFGSQLGKAAICRYSAPAVDSDTGIMQSRYKMYLAIDELKKHAPNTVSMEDYVGSLRKDEPTIILRNYRERG
jgi:hypothetical protein